MSTTEAYTFRETSLLFHRQEKVLDFLRRGEVSDIRVSQSYAADKIVSFGLREGILQKGLGCFPDPRQRVEVPADVMLVPQIFERLHDEHSLLLAPYMLNDADLITKLGYNARVLENGFNNRAKYPREAPFHGETLKHLLNLISRPDILIDWFNHDWLPIWREAAPGRTRQYILDGMKIETPRPKKRKREGSGVVSDKEGAISYGYKAVWLQEIIDRKGILVAMAIVPIQVNDQEVAKSLVDSFPFEANSVLIMDRGFIDASWFVHLKTTKKVDIVVPLKKNMELTERAICVADRENLWQPHPNREKQWIASIGEENLFWKDCEVLKSATLVRWQNRKTSETEQVLFVSTLDGKAGAKLLRIYDQRAEIEDSHRELKCFQGIETLPSGKLVHVVFRIIMNVLGFNLLRLFLNSEECDSLEDFTAKTLRQRRRQEPNPKIIVYTANAFATIYFLDLLFLITTLPKKALKNLSLLIKELKNRLKLDSS